MNDEQFIPVHGVVLCDVHFGVAPDHVEDGGRCDQAGLWGMCHFVELYRKHAQAVR